jgi:hypothetical protein
MSQYSTNPTKENPRLALDGDLIYLFGSLDRHHPTTRMSVQSVAIASNVATLGVTVIEGLIPAVGSLITVVGTLTDSGAANVVNVAIASVTINATTGIGTVTYAATGSNQSTTADVGYALVPVPEVSEALANNTASIPCCASYNPALVDGSRSVRAVVSFPTLPTTAVVQLQVALTDQDSEYQNLVQVASVTGSALTGGMVTTTLDPGRFYRFKVTGLTGSGLIIAKLLM